MIDTRTRLHRNRMQPLYLDTPLVSRTALLAKYRLRNAHLTVIHAPAGYGKTTFLSQWFAVFRQQGKHACWLTLDESIDDPFLLLAYLINALNSTDLIKRELLEIASNNFEGLDHEEALNLVINEISEFEQHVSILLDDYHLISNDASQRMMHKLLESTSERAHFILATRKLSTALKARLQISRSYSEITVSDLALSYTETCKLLRLTPSIDISDELITVLHDKTRGWVAAIISAKVALNDGNEIDHKTVDHCTRDFSSFVSTQIFDQLPTNWQSAMIRTSIAREFDGNLLNLICGIENGWEIIDDFSQQGLAITPNHAESNYRYHPLLKEFLQNHFTRIDSAKRITLHKCVTDWFLRNGNFRDAIKHALACSDANFIAEVTEKAGGWHFILDGRLTTFTKIINHVSTEIIERYPSTYLGKIMLIAKHGEVTKAYHLFDEFRAKTRNFITHNDQALTDSFKIEADVVSFFLDGLSDTPQTTQHMKKMESVLKEVRDNDHFLAAVLQNFLCFGYFLNDQYSKAFSAGEAAISHFREIGSIYGENFLYFHLGKICLAQGRLRDAEQFYDEGYSLAVKNYDGSSDIIAIAAAHLSEIAYEKNQLDEVQKFLDICLPQVEHSEAWLDVYLSAYFSAANICHRRGSFRKAMTVLNRASKTGRTRNYRRLRLLSATQCVRFLIDRGKLKKAHWIIHKLQFHNIINSDITGLLIGNRVVNEFILVIAYFYIHNNQSLKATKLIEPLLTKTRRNNNRRNLISLLILSSSAYFKQDKHMQAMSRFNEAVSNSVFEGFKQPFLEHASETREIIEFALANTQLFPINRLKRTFLTDLTSIINRQKNSGLVQEKGTLTPREKEMVKHVCDGCSNKEIARICHCSENTVKFHLKNVFSKLGVQKRKALAEIAREPNIL